MKRFLLKHKTWFAAVTLSSVAVLGFIGCGKSSSGGPVVQNPGLLGIAQNCNGMAGCMTASMGQALPKAGARLNYDDALDTGNNQARVMEIYLNMNTVQATGTPYGAGTMMNQFGYTVNGRELLMTYVGAVMVSGTLNVIGNVMGCNLPPGTYNLQQAQPGWYASGNLSVPLFISVNNGSPISIVLNNVGIQPGYFGMYGATALPGQQMQTGAIEATIAGAAIIPECNNATFRME